MRIPIWSVKSLSSLNLKLVTYRVWPSISYDSQARLNFDAIEMWKKPEWEGTFHESGVIVSGTDGHASCGYVDSSFENVRRDPALKAKEGGEQAG